MGVGGRACGLVRARARWGGGGAGGEFGQGSWEAYCEVPVWGAKVEGEAKDDVVVSQLHVCRLG